MSPEFWVAALVAGSCVGLSKGGFPIIGMLAVPILSLTVPPVRAAALLLPLYNVTDVFGVIAYRREFDKRNLAILIPAGLAGMLVGWATSAYVPERFVTLLIGVIGISFCLNAYLRRNQERAAVPAALGRGLFWGTVAGFTSFVSHSGAPPYQIYVLPQKLEKLVFVGTSTLLFAVINAAKVPAYFSLGQITFLNLKLMLMIFPVAIAATFAGFWLVKVLPQRLFYQFVVVALLIISIKLVFDGLHG
ncbi:MAG: sulfite exporter TauE/SafE family protein [Hyphomicrobiales bacterium]|nr:sulfite exporter TauE/SafE family protein [Hyphomicrobiales bacterium]MDE2113504.1 sulfite exporter TauE/SafE family protein [Hyphomicrobiales bacterium]